VNGPAPLRIGVLLDDLNAPAWACSMLQTIKDGQFATIELLVVDNGPEPPSSKAPGYPKWQQPFQSACAALADSIYNGFINRDNGADDAVQSQSIKSLLPDTAILNVRTEKTEHTDQLDAESIVEISSYELDVILRVGFRILRGDVLTVAKHGVWSLMTSDNRLIRGGPPCFWESMQSQPIVGSGLQILSDELDHVL